MDKLQLNARLRIIIAIVLVVAIVLAILLPNLHARRTQQKLEDITKQPVQRQDAPTVPIRDSPAPPVPAP